MENAVGESDLHVSALTGSLLLSSGLNAIHVFSEGGEQLRHLSTGRLRRFLSAIRQGRPFERNAGMTFAIYKYQFEETPLRMETHTVRVGANGSYNVQLVGGTENLAIDENPDPWNCSVQVKRTDRERA
jgi:hypothetical protein